MESYSLCAIGAPLADVIISEVKSGIFDKFALPRDGTVVGSEQLLETLLAEYGEKIEHLRFGGSAVNTLRVFRAASNYSNDSLGICVGSVGDDCVSRQIKSKLEANEGILCQFETIKSPQIRSGCCFSLPNVEGRCLVSFPSASRHLTSEFIRSVLENAVTFRKCRTVFIVSYLLNISFQLVETISEECSKLGVSIVLSLSSPQICKMHAHNIQKLLLSKQNLVPLLLGNRSEVETLVRTLTGQSEKDLEDCVSWLASSGGRTVVATCGREGKVYIGDGSGNVTQYLHNKIDNSQLIKDATGAGDAFAGGFLAKFLKNEPLSTCVEAGFLWAGEILQNTGCQLPNRDSKIVPCRNASICAFCSNILTSEC